jgi:hypothetical protein
MQPAWYTLLNEFYHLCIKIFITVNTAIFYLFNP